MAEYIEREKLIDELQHLPEQGELDYLGVFDCVNTTPTADVVKVVRCKDCKHCEHINDEFARDYYQCKIRGNFFHKKSDDFCSCGELKECEGK